MNRSLRVLDGAVVVFDGVAGVEPQSETNWRLADNYNVPRMCYVNKMDRSGASFTRCVDMIDKRLGARPLPLQIPIGSEDNFKGMIDLVEMKALVWDSDDKDSEWQTLDVTPDLADKLGITVPTDRAILGRCQKYRTELVDTAWSRTTRPWKPTCDGNEPSIETLRACLRKGTHHRRLHARAVRLLVQEQGRAAGARRRRRLPARPDRRRGHQHRGCRRQPDRRAQVLGRRAVLGAGVQGHQRRLRRADLRARVFRRAGQGRLGA